MDGSTAQQLVSELSEVWSLVPSKEDSCPSHPQQSIIPLDPDDDDYFAEAL